MSQAERIRIATRKSPLALWQAEEVARQLKSRNPELEIELVKIVSKETNSSMLL